MAAISVSRCAIRLTRGVPDLGNTAHRDWAAVATENHIRAGPAAAMGYPRFGMLDLLELLSGLLVGVFRSPAAREAEIAFLRHQLENARLPVI